MAAPVIIALGGALLRIASKQLPRYLEKGAKLIEKPTKSQIKKAKSLRTEKKLKEDPIRRKKPKKRSGKFDTRDEAEKAADLAEFEADFGPDPDAEYTPQFSMDRFYASGGSVKKNYAYGGRVAKMSAEKS